MDVNTKLKELGSSNLLLIIGGPGSGKSKIIRDYSEEAGIPILDLDKLFGSTPSDKLLDELKKFVASYKSDVLLVDNKKALYEKNDDIDLLVTLKELAKSKKVVATWNGHIEDGQLVHIRKDHDDLIYPVDDSFKYILA